MGSQLSEARKQVRNDYGKAFESKASDALVMSIARPAVFSTTFAPKRNLTYAVSAAPIHVATEARGRVAPLAAPGVPRPSTAIIELAVPPRSKSRIPSVEAVRIAGKGLARSLEEVGATKGKAGVESLLRQLRATQIRKAVYAAAAPLRVTMGQNATTALLETVPFRGTPNRVTQVCWLNSTLRTVADLPALAEVAHDKNVQRIGLPRLLRPDATTLKPGDVLGATAFRERTHLTGKGIVVAVLDTEIAHRHPAFQERVVLKENYTQEPWGRPHAHGTAVAGLLAAKTRGFVGIAPEATIYHYKVIATDSSLNADDFGGAVAIQQALEDGAQIANCSWGIGPAGDGTSREARAFDQAWDLGLAIVKSAGNGGPADGTLTSPADARGVIVVGATDPSGTRVIPESSRGSQPGRKPDCVAPGGSAEDWLSSCEIAGTIGRVGYGTSFAAPQVAGILALLLAKDPDQTPDALRSALLRLCHLLPNAGATAQGGGLPRL